MHRFHASAVMRARVPGPREHRGSNSNASQPFPQKTRPRTFDGPGYCDHVVSVVS